MLKNWLVKLQQKRQALAHIKYLSNQNAKSHESTRIVILRDNSETLINANDKRAEYRKENKLKGSYRVKNECVSYILSIPSDITQPSDQQWLKLSNHVLSQLWEHINKKIEINNKKNLISNLKNPKKKQPLLQKVSKVDFAKHCHVVLHDESEDPSKNSHLHILISNVVNNEVIKPLSQAGAIYNVKQSFNYAMKKLVNEDHIKYQPKTSIFTGNDTDFSTKKAVEMRPKYYKYASEFKAIFERLKKNFNNWLEAVYLKKTLKIAELAEKTASDIKKLENTKTEEISIILETAKTVEEQHELPELLKITSKVKTTDPRKRRRRKKKQSTPKSKPT